DAQGAQGAHDAGAAVTVPRADGLAPLPRRVPQTSLAVELREEAPVAGAEEGDTEDFTADHAASSLAGFQRGTRRARDEETALDGPQDPVGSQEPEGSQDPVADSAAADVPKEATAYGMDPLDTPGDREPPDGPLDAPQDPAVAARGPHTDRS
ncbi:histidine kinase, partial [Streptomyces griseorubiginosus]